MIAPMIPVMVMMVERLDIYYAGNLVEQGEFNGMSNSL